MKTRAAVLYTAGAARPYAESRPLVVDELTLDPPGSGEVLVQLAAAGLCHSDLSAIDGSRPRALPVVVGHEAAGIVRETGPGVAGFTPGDHVVFSFVPVCGGCEPCLAGRGALCEKGMLANVAGTLLSGAVRFANASAQPCFHHLGVSGFSQFTVAAQESLVRIDGDISLATAALFGCAVMTGVGAVVNTARVEPGASVAVFGLGGVGLSAVMGARAAGAAAIVAVDRVPAKLALASELGATHVVDASNIDPVAAVRDATGGGASYVFETVGSETVLVQAYEATRRGGTTVTAGLPHPARSFTIPAVSLTLEERTLKGSYMGSCVPRRDIPRFLAMHRAGLLPVERLHTHTIALDDVNAGFDRLARAEAVRQIIAFG